MTNLGRFVFSTPIRYSFPQAFVRFDGKTFWVVCNDRVVEGAESDDVKTAFRASTSTARHLANATSACKCMTCHVAFDDAV